MAMAGLVGTGKPLLVHAIGGLMILVLAVILSVFKPWGLTAYGRRRLQSANFPVAVDPRKQTGSPKGSVNGNWVRIAVLVGIGAVFGFAVLHHLRSGVPAH